MPSKKRTRLSHPPLPELSSMPRLFVLSPKPKTAFNISAVTKFCRAGNIDSKGCTMTCVTIPVISNCKKEDGKKSGDMLV
ncbi:hypothetical protein JCM11251_004660 [Rhodosporidiobolus azoricus]